MESLQNTVNEKLQNLILKGFDPVSAHGFIQVPRVILTNTELTIYAKLVYSMLLGYAWEKDRCFPGQEKLAEDLGISRDSVIKGIKELEDKGYLESKRRGLGKTNLYTLMCKPKRKR